MPKIQEEHRRSSRRKQGNFTAESCQSLSSRKNKLHANHLSSTNVTTTSANIQLSAIISNVSTKPMGSSPTVKLSTEKFSSKQ
jgi:hypothetical protein